MDKILNQDYPGISEPGSMHEYDILRTGREAILKAISRNRDRELLLSEVCRISIDTFNFRNAIILYKDSRHYEFLIKSRSGPEELQVLYEVATHLNSQVKKANGAFESIVQGIISVYNDVESWPYSGTLKEWLLKTGTNSIVTLPFKSNEIIIGALLLLSDKKILFSSHELSLLEEISEDVSFALKAIETDRQREEDIRLLKRSQDDLKRIQDIAKIGNWTNDFKGKATWSDAIYEFLEVDPASFTPDSWSILKFVHPEDEFHMREWFNSWMDGRDPGELIWRALLKNGKVKYISARGKAVVDHKGRFKYLEGISQDISHRMLVEEALRESDLRFRLLLESSLDGILLTSPEGIIYSANVAACEMLDRTESEICKLGMQGILDLNDQRIDKFLEERRQKGKARGEMTMVHQDGTRFPVEISSSVFLDRKKELKTSMIFRNITERYKIEEKLRKSEEKYRLLAENSADVIWTLNPEGAFTYVSPSVEKLRGFTPEEILKQPISSALTPDSLKIANERIQYVMNRIQQGELFNEYSVFELEQPCKDGTTVWTEAAVKPTFNESGVFTGYLGITRNITERKEAERKVAQHVREQLLIAQISEKLVSFTSRQEIYEYISQQIYNLTDNAYVMVSHYNSDSDSMRLTALKGFGNKFNDVHKKFGINAFAIEIGIEDLTPEEIIRHTSKKLIIHKKGLYNLSARKLDKKICSALEKFFGIESVFSMGFSWGGKLYGGIGIMTRDRRPLHNRSLIETIIKQASVALQRLYTWEELVSSEKKYRSLVELSPDGIVLTDAEGKMISCNQELVNIFGYKTADEMKGNFRSSTGSFIAQYRINDKVRSNKKTRESLTTRVIQMRRQDGTEFPAEVKSALVRNIEGKPNMLLSIIRDITERKLAEEQLSNYNEQLRNYSAHSDLVREQERINLARDIHDIFGSSLAGLKMELAILKKFLKDDNKMLSSEINQQMQAMSQQIDESVDLMREIVRELRPGILDELGLFETLKWYAAEIEKRSGIACNISITRKEVKIDSRRAVIIFRIFQEILTNIIRHSGASRVLITVKFRNRNLVQMRIEDNGKGITEEEIANKNSFGMIGMKERTQLLHGTLAINSMKDRGTTIILDIPVQIPDK